MELKAKKFKLLKILTNKITNLRIFAPVIPGKNSAGQERGVRPIRAF
jgi:hypothetical protein